MIGHVLNDRYQLCEKLGEGGMAIVYRAFDRDTQQQVALKVMKTRLTAPSQKRFVREFRAISSLQHPNCIKVFEFGETPEFPFFTMELFHGAFITTLYGKSLATILSGLYQAAAAIQYVHANRIIHRDLKPSNLLVRIDRNGEAGAAVEAKLADFGLALYFETPSSLTDERAFLGTLQYCAPEQINNRAVDLRADLYSLGLVCYETLTGSYPFARSRRAGLRSLIRAQFSELPLPLKTLRPDIPQSLHEAVMALLAKDPGERPTSTASLQEAIAEQIEVPFDDRGPQPSAALFEPELDWQGVVGRERELGQVRDYLHRSLSPHTLSQSEWRSAPIPSVLLMTGEAGIGKSNLLGETQQLAHQRGAHVFEGRCFEGNLAAYQPFVEILSQVLRQAPGSRLAPADDLSWSRGEQRVDSPAASSEQHALPPTQVYYDPADPLQNLLADYRSEILRIAPDLSKWLPGEAFRQVDLSRETDYVLRAIADFFVELSTVHGTLLCIEDLQWADPSTINLLRHITSALFHSREASVASNAAPPRMAICGTLRSGHPDAGTLVQELTAERQAAALEIPPLSELDVSEIISCLLQCGPDQLSAELSATVHRMCGGNPFFVRETLQAWKAAKQIERFEGRWQLAARDRETVWPVSMRDVLQNRLRAISSTARRLLAVSAVGGAVVPTDLLHGMCVDTDENELLDGLEELFNRCILTEAKDGLTVEFSHDLLREMAYEELSASRRRALHRRIGETLEQMAGAGRGASVNVLAEHFYAAGESRRAFPYLVAAAESALHAYAIDDAINLLTRASEIAGDVAAPDESRRVANLLATAYSAAGHPVEAIQLYRSQLPDADDGLATGIILEKLGSLHFRIGNFDDAICDYDQALHQLGLRRARSAAGAAFSAAFYLLRHYWPNSLRLRRRLHEPQRQIAILARDCFNGLTKVWPHRSFIRSLEADARQLFLAQRIGDVRLSADTYSEHAIYPGVFSLNRVALHAGQRALHLAQQSQDADAIAIAKGALGCVHYYGARLEKAHTLLREAIAVLDRRGDSWFRLFFHHNLRHIYAILGDTKNEIASAQVEIQIGEAVADPEGHCWGAYGIANALARSGRLDEARDYMDLALAILADRQESIVIPTALQTDGFLLLQSADYQAARETLERARAMIRKNWTFVDYTVRTYPLLVESMLGPHWHLASDGPDRADIRPAWKLSRQALFWGKRFPNYLPHALRACGRAACARGRRRLAVDFFRRSITAGEKIGARYDLARSCLDLARVGAGDRDQYTRAGQAGLAELDAAIPPAEAVD